MTLLSDPSTKTTTGNVMKRADQRTSITILVVGDEGVGKSSLLSTFISRYFTEQGVPGVLTRVRLPPVPLPKPQQLGHHPSSTSSTSPSPSSCITTIIDTQAGDVALLQHSQQKQPQQSGENATQPSATKSSLESASTTTAPFSTAAPTSNSSSSSSSSFIVDTIDSIILVYDLSRTETFTRLESHWLPLIEQCYDGKIPVIIAENKFDLFRPSSTTTGTTTMVASTSQQHSMEDDQVVAMARMKRQQIVLLMQRFPFVRQCIKCSAKQLLLVDDVFYKAQQAVLYPLVPPLYDLETGQLTRECQRALTRIFRMYDTDGDGLLSDTEWDKFQRDTFHFHRTMMVDTDNIAAWKKVVTRNNPSETDEQVLQDGKFTIQGFFTMFDIYIGQNRLDVVWQALRKFNYDDDLNLHVPDAIINPEECHLKGVTLPSSSSWKLSSAAKQYLTNLFRQFDSDRDGYLSPDDIIAIFSILPPPALPPWHPMRAPELFEGCFSVPKESPPTNNNGSSSGTDSPAGGDFGGDTSLIVPSATMAVLHQHDHSMLSTSGVSILSASDSLPTLDVGGMYPLSKSLSYLEWMGHWHTISAISPAITRVELYRLGYVDSYCRKSRHVASRRRNSTSRLSYRKAKPKLSLDSQYYDMTLPSREILVTVLGKRNCGKTALLNSLCGLFDADSNNRAIDTSITYRPETSTISVKVKRSYVTGISSGTNEREDEELVVHLVFMDVPESAAVRQEEHLRQLNELFGPANATSKDRFCDVAMLVFDSTDANSLDVAKDMESKLLTKDTPRLFVATKHDLVGSEIDDGSEAVYEKASFHCRETDLELPLSTSALQPKFDRDKILNHIVRCALDNESGITRLKSRPHEAEKRREAARRRNMLWFGGIVSVGVAVAVGVGLLLAGGVTAAKKDQKSSFSWLRSLFVGAGLRVPKDTPQTLRS